MEGGIQSGGADTSAFKECFSLASNNPFVLRLAFSAGIGGLLFGYDTGVISGALLYIRDDFTSVDTKTLLQEAIVSMAVAGAIIGAAIGGWLNDKYGCRSAILVADFLFFIGAVLMAAAPNPPALSNSFTKQEAIVSMAVAGAIIGAAIGGWLNDKYGCRSAILVADFLFFIGAVLMAAAPNPPALIVGRVFVDPEARIASMTSPLYISEASPAKIRGALISTNGFLITGGQFLSYLINLAFTKAPGTWWWMLGVAGLPALLQFILMLLLPESPRWLYRKHVREDEAEAILKKIYSPEQVRVEMQNLKESIEKEALENSSSEKVSTTKLLQTTTVRRGLVAGVRLQVFQQFVGINTVMYYSPTIVQLAGFASNQIALLLSLVTAGFNAFGSIVSIYFIDRTGRKKLLVISLCGVIASLGVLSAVFHKTASHSPTVGAVETSRFAPYTCPDYRSAGPTPAWDCMKCLKAASPTCGFCAPLSENKMIPGACLVSNNTVRDEVCHGEGKAWYTRGCPSSFGWLALDGLSLYILFFSPGMGTVPWIINSEIYPLRFRGICRGIAATANWISNLIVAQSFLSLTEAIGTSWTFFLFGVVSVVALLFFLVCVPETKGLPIEEMRKMLERRALQLKFWEGRSDTVKKNLQV